MHLFILLYFTLLFYKLFYVTFAHMEKKKYNLRSRRNDDLQIPVQLQFSDNGLMTNLLGSNNLLGTQEESDSALSGSDLNCSGIVEHTDSDDAGTQMHSFHRLSPDSPSTFAQPTAALSSENLITQKILDQLQVIGSRLDT